MGYCGSLRAIASAAPEFSRRLIPGWNGSSERITRRPGAVRRVPPCSALEPFAALGGPSRAVTRCSSDTPAGRVRAAGSLGAEPKGASATCLAARNTSNGTRAFFAVARSRLDEAGSFRSLAHRWLTTTAEQVFRRGPHTPWRSPFMEANNRFPGALPRLSRPMTRGACNLRRFTT